MRILIVEDEVLIRKRLLRLCSELAGSRARFDAVADLDLAGDRLQRNLYDGLLLDLNLGGEDRVLGGAGRGNGVGQVALAVVVEVVPDGAAHHTALRLNETKVSARHKGVQRVKLNLVRNGLTGLKRCLGQGGRGSHVSESHGRIVGGGRSLLFLAGELVHEDGTLIATASGVFKRVTAPAGDA